MRRVLMIAPQFPPSRAVAAKRPLHFARHLPQHGWEAAVVCLESTVLREPALEELIPPVPLYRGYRGGPFARLEDRRAQKKSARAQQSVYAAQHKRAQSKKGLMARFIQAFKRSFNIFDQYMKHLPWVRGPIEHFMREQQCEVIYATGGPFSALVLSAWLAKRSGLPLILDLRDPWSIEPNYRADRSRLGQWIIDYVEARCFQRAQSRHSAQLIRGSVNLWCDHWCSLLALPNRTQILRRATCLRQRDTQSHNRLQRREATRVATAPRRRQRR